ncbi:MAG TPA: Nif11-like leader peptide family natural product precursor [Pyrinomonadaceae bacterium]|jgi:hypothetical protein|nr:Nif11-like leader peptide family natural product precursor [Pyrinomonadaceae bacterium]
MSKENLKQFCQLVLRDLNLQDQLKVTIEREAFIAQVIVLGAKSGFEISREDVDLQLRENRSLWHERWI